MSIPLKISDTIDPEFLRYKPCVIRKDGFIIFINNCPGMIFTKIKTLSHGFSSAGQYVLHGKTRSFLKVDLISSKKLTISKRYYRTRQITQRRTLFNSDFYFLPGPPFLHSKELRIGLPGNDHAAPAADIEFHFVAVSIENSRGCLHDHDFRSAPSFKRLCYLKGRCKKTILHDSPSVFLSRFYIQPAHHIPSKST